MKKSIAVLLLFVFTTPMFGEVFVDLGQAAYIGGTLTNIKAETMGKLDTTQEKFLAFNHEGGRAVIPYDKIESWKYDEVLARHLGVIATTVVVLLKHRQRRHMLQVQFKDDSGVTQSAVFEVAKEQPRVVVAVLQARVKACSITAASWPSDPLGNAYANCDVPKTAKKNVIPSQSPNGNNSQTAQYTVPPGPRD